MCQATSPAAPAPGCCRRRRRRRRRTARAGPPPSPATAALTSAWPATRPPLTWPPPPRPAVRLKPPCSRHHHSTSSSTSAPATTTITRLRRLTGRHSVNHHQSPTAAGSTALPTTERIAVAICTNGRTWPPGSEALSTLSATCIGRRPPARSVTVAHHGCCTGTHGRLMPPNNNCCDHLPLHSAPTLNVDTCPCGAYIAATGSPPHRSGRCYWSVE